jgi:hypothetical protein
MPADEPAPSEEGGVCQWINQSMALKHFAGFSGKIESAAHIKPLHWYVACRLVIEGGFDPDDITPRPPFKVTRSKGKLLLNFDPKEAAGGERTLLGGLKTKNVDVVVTKDGIGPVLAVSCKGVTGAFRNLTNRLEETIGECTNLHITYPALVLGYLVIMRANREADEALAAAAPENAPPAKKLAANDIAIKKGGEPVEAIIRFHAALREMTGRRGIRNDVSRYEAISLAMLDVASADAGAVLEGFPPADSRLRLEQFFETLYLRYDERFVYSAPTLNKVTRRREWAAESPIFQPDAGYPQIDYPPRISGSDSE